MSLHVRDFVLHIWAVASMVDRGRMLGQLDSELLGICQPPNTGSGTHAEPPARISEPSVLGPAHFCGKPASASVGVVSGGTDEEAEANAER